MDPKNRPSRKRSMNNIVSAAANGYGKWIFDIRMDSEIDIITSR